MSLRHKNVLGTHSAHLTRSEREMKILQARHGQSARAHAARNAINPVKRLNRIPDVVAFISCKNS